MDIEKVLLIMQKEAKDAPVYKLEKNSDASPFQILIATLLSARTKDTTTAKILPELFKKAKTPEQFLKINKKELEKTLYWIGFYRIKTRRVKEVSRIILDKFGGIVPKTIEELLTLPGVGRKTANIVLARAFGRDTLGVDVHVHRISNRLGLVRTKKPEETEEKLMKILEKKHIRKFNKTLVAYGQTICVPIRPFCSICKLNNICPKVGVKDSR